MTTLKHEAPVFSEDVDRRLTALANQQFRGKSRRFVETHLDAFIERFLDWHFGSEPPKRRPALAATPKPATRQPPAIRDTLTANGLRLNVRCELSPNERVTFLAQLESIPRIFAAFLAKQNPEMSVVEKLHDIPEVPASLSPIYSGCCVGGKIVVVRRNALSGIDNVFGQPTLIHEMGHVLDMAFKPMLSSRFDWQTVWRQCRGVARPDVCNARSDAGESLAENFARFVGSCNQPEQVWWFFHALERTLAAQC